MQAPKLKLRSIDSLVDDAFVIPSYQRGYRWSEVEVRALLDDLDEFRQAKRREGRDAPAAEARGELGRFYCLQPVVVLPREPADDGRARWELIDGQQRLTTIYLIIRYLESQNVRVRGRYTLCYDTRKSRYLETLDPDLQWESPDAFYMHQATLAIEDWFRDKGFYAPNDLAEVLLLPDGRADFNTKVIWYELPAADEGSRAEIDAFIRLNAGKIRLTNAELIRALFLKAGNFDPSVRSLAQVKMAQEWDRIEKRLQEDSFWYFLHGGPSPYATRIDHLFRVHLEAAHPDLLESIPPTAEFRTFLGYQRLEKDLDPDEGSISDQWDGVRKLAMRLEEWDGDRVLYHLVGFWITVRSADGDDNASVLVDLLARRERERHHAFEEGIKAGIFRRLIEDCDPTRLDPAELGTLVRERLSATEYPSDRLKPLLLLFNIATLLRNPTSKVRFPFDLFLGTGGWDLEHIRPVESRRPRTVPSQKAWLDVVFCYWTGMPSAAWNPTDPTESAAMRTRVQRRLNSRPADEPGELAAHLLADLGLPPSDELDLTAELTEAARERAAQADKVASLLARVCLLLTEEKYTLEARERFATLYDDVLAHFGENEAIEADNSIGNLTLLDASTNRGIGNAPFPLKRKHVLRHDRSGTFVPRCTTNVFVKYYSQRFSHLLTWTQDSATAYQEAIAETLTAFFLPGGHRADGGHRG